MFFSSQEGFHTVTPPGVSPGGEIPSFRRTTCPLRSGGRFGFLFDFLMFSLLVALSTGPGQGGTGAPVEDGAS